MDLFELIREDHEKARRLFERMDSTDSLPEAEGIFRELDNELSWHASAEEEVLYPNARKMGDTEDLIDHAQEEHDKVKKMLSEMRGEGVLNENFREKILELREMVEDHLEEEEGELFPKLEGSLDDRTRTQMASKFEEVKNRLMASVPSRASQQERRPGV